MNQLKKIILLTKSLFWVFLIFIWFQLVFALISFGSSLLDIYGDGCWTSISFYTEIVMILKSFIVEVLIGVAFLGVVQVWGKRVLRKFEITPKGVIN